MTTADLQRRLARLGNYTGPISGKFDAATRAATLAALTDGPDYELTDYDVAQAAKRLGATTRQIWAVYRTESTGNAFIDGRPAILFEPHRFSKATKHVYDASHPKISSRVWNKKLYPGSQLGRWNQLLDAVGLNVDAGFASASYGGFQILGENYAVCDAADPWSFAWRQSRTEGDQLDAFCLFVEKNGLKNALRMISNDPETCRPFAKGYNGTAYAVNNYHVKIAESHRAAR